MRSSAIPPAVDEANISEAFTPRHLIPLDDRSMMVMSGEWPVAGMTTPVL
jgi:hypothetical protein